MPYRDVVHSGVEVSGNNLCGGLAKKAMTEECAVFGSRRDEESNGSGGRKAGGETGMLAKEKVEEEEVEEKVMERCSWGEA